MRGVWINAQTKLTFSGILYGYFPIVPEKKLPVAEV